MADQSAGANSKLTIKAAVHPVLCSGRVSANFCGETTTNIAMARTYVGAH